MTSIIKLSQSHIIAFFIQILDELFPPVENVTVTDVGPTVFTVQWNVSINFIRLKRIDSSFHTKYSCFFFSPTTSPVAFTGRTFKCATRTAVATVD